MCRHDVNQRMHRAYYLFIYLLRRTWAEFTGGWGAIAYHEPGDNKNFSQQ